MIEGFRPEEKGYFFNPVCCQNLGENQTLSMVIWEQGKRVFHVAIQHDPYTGACRYGACVYKCDGDWWLYDVVKHTETAYARFEKFPVFCSMKLCYGMNYTTRSVSRGEFPHTNFNFWVIHNAMCIFGVRDRSVKNPFVGVMRLKEYEVRVTNKQNRLQGTLDSEKRAFDKIQAKKVVEMLPLAPVRLSRSKLVDRFTKAEQDMEKVLNRKSKRKKIYKEKFTNRPYAREVRLLEKIYKESRVSKEKKSGVKTKTKRQEV